MTGSNPLRRGEWSVADSQDGFVLTIRPRIGPLSVLSAAWLIVWGALLLYCVYALSTPGPRWYVGLFAVLYTGLFTSLCAIGSVWLAFGTTTLTGTGDAFSISYEHNPLAKPQCMNRTDIHAISFDRRWAFKGFAFGYNSFGVFWNRGPVVLDTRPYDGRQLSIGGNLDQATALAIRDAVGKRLGLTYQQDDVRLTSAST